MFQTIIILIILFALFIFFGRIKIEVVISEESCIKGYILKYIKVAHFRFNKDEMKEIETRGKRVAKDEVSNYFKDIKITDAKILISNVRELLGKVKYDKINFELNINFKDYILNCYIVTLFNTILSIIISKNIDRININNLNYIVTSNKNETKLKLKCIMYGKITNIMFVVIKVVFYAFKLKKRGNEKNGEGTSNRKFNGNGDVIARSNG